MGFQIILELVGKNYTQKEDPRSFKWAIKEEVKERDLLL